jgi:hypothetical protein
MVNGGKSTIVTDPTAGHHLIVGGKPVPPNPSLRRHVIALWGDRFVIADDYWLAFKY